jgi:16S rRNA processing protein RimM
MLSHRHSGARQRREPGTQDHGTVPSAHEPVFMGSGADPAGLLGMTKGGKRVCLGIVTAAHGVRGAVKVKSFAQRPRDVASYGPLEDEDGLARYELRVIGAAKGDIVVAKLSGIADRDTADAMRGSRLYLPREALPAPAEEEYYHADLIGLAALLGDGARLGEVRAVHDFGAGDTLEIVRPEGQPVMVPFTRAVVPVINVAAGHIVLDPPEGLIDPPARERPTRAPKVPA